eukprot:TRINITY_DN29579_c0_g1_i1.p1 TRINITY_DN29579_c0_g1~~TRINITY_DN29579_c0_g1_i1.p1  ORF type:complete len:457 (-),score=111.87 TRINITY_DN29579_c0_g1_i1:333-1703(-)
MVLSNKKLKQKIRETLAEQSEAPDTAGKATASEKSNAVDGGGCTSDIQSLLEISRKSRRAMKKKRKLKVQSLKGIRAEDIEKAADESHEVSKKKKKRKKDATDSKESETGNKDSESRKPEDNDGTSSKKQKKKKKKYGNGGSGDKQKAPSSSDLQHGNTEGKKKEKRKRKNEDAELHTESAVENAGKKNDKRKEMENGVAKTEQSSAAEDIVISAATKNVQDASKDSEYDKLKVYVGGIPYYSNEDDIRSFFESCGTITDIDCMTFPDSGKFRGIALISFKTEAAANRALALDGSDMGGRFLKIQRCRNLKGTGTGKITKFEPSVRGNYNRAYIGNLDWNITEDDLYELFKDCEVSSIRFGTDKNTGDFKGYGHVDFTNEVSLAMALKLDQTIVCGRPIRISHAVPKEATSKDGAKTGPDSGKKKRRQTCYRCGQPGHISSSCTAGESGEPEDADS